MGTGSPVGGRAMVLTRRTLETLIDLVEIKLSCIETYDQEDRRELRVLEQARSELAALSNPGSPGAGELLVPLPRRRGRPRKVIP